MKFYFLIVLLLFALTRVIFSHFGEISLVNPDCLGNNVYGIGSIVSEPESKDTNQIFIVKIIELAQLDSFSLNKKDCNGYAFLKIRTSLFPEYSFGDYIKFSGKLSQPFNFTSENGREFDYKNYLAKDDIYAEIRGAKIEIAENYSNLSESKSNNFLINSFSIIKNYIQKKLFAIKNSFVTSLSRILGEPHSALASGLVVGEKSALGKDLLNDFRAVGLIHIIVLSGFNITIIGDALRRVLSFLPRNTGIIIGGTGMILFGIMVGGGATVVRSCIMASVALFGELLRRDYNVLRALIFAGSVMVIINPMILLHDPSFQLSFLATLGLILLASPIENFLHFVPEAFGLRGTIASTLATQIFVSPFILYMMGQISIIGMLVNILVLPFVPFTMLAVFITGFLGMIWYPLSFLFGWISHLLLSYELLIVEKFAQVPYASIDIKAFSFWWVVGFYVVFVVVYVGVRASKKKDSSMFG